MSTPRSTVSYQPPASHTGRANAAPASGANDARQVQVLGCWDQILVSGGRDQRIAHIAGVQRGRVSRSQLIAAGISTSAIDTRLHSGRLHREHAGVYAVGHRAEIELGNETAALLAVGGDAVLCLDSAAGVWSAQLRDRAAAPVDVLVASGRDVRRRGIWVHRTRLFDRMDLAIRHGLPVTSPARTLLDLAAARPQRGVGQVLRRLEYVLDRFLIDRLVTEAKVEAVIARLCSHPGRVRLASMLGSRHGPTLTRSEAEERLLELVRAAGLPEPEVNVDVCGYEVDMLWLDERLVLEVDGYQFHGHRDAFERDRRRDAVLQANGFATVRVTWRQLIEEPYAVIARLAQAIAVARATTGRSR